MLEAEQRAGGHAHTLDLNLDGQTVPVDTGCVTVRIIFFDCFYKYVSCEFDRLMV